MATTNGSGRWGRTSSTEDSPFCPKPDRDLARKRAVHSVSREAPRIRASLTLIEDTPVAEMPLRRGPLDIDFCSCAVDRRFFGPADRRRFWRTGSREHDLRLLVSHATD